MAEAGTEPDPSRLRTLLEECLARREAGGDAAAETFLAEHPAEAPALRERLEALGQAGFLAAPSAEANFDGAGAIGEFALVRKLGEGGMGIVYLAEQRTLGRKVALKVVRPGHLFFGGARERFRREVEAVARLQHPGIVPIHVVGEEGGVPYFAMEFVEGCSLADALAALRGSDPRRLTGRDLARAVAAQAGAGVANDPEPRSGWLFEGSWTETCLRLVREAAEALDHAHRRGVVHRDVKPSNLMVTPAGRVLLLDFGLAATDGASRLTRTGSQLGSLPYLSPEQVRGESGAIGPRTDVYGLGVTLYEMLTLRLPFEEKTTEVLMRVISEGRPEPPRKLNASVSWDAETVCLTAMESDASRRYASAADLVRDLENVLHRRPIEARRPSAARRARQWIARHPAAATAWALAAIVALGGPLLVAKLAIESRAVEGGLRHADGLRLSAAARAVIARDPGLAVALAIEGAERAPGLVANASLLASLRACREIRTLAGHEGAILALRHAPDGKVLATGGSDGRVFLWDARTGAARGGWRADESRVVGVEFAGGGARLRTVSENGAVKEWECESGREAGGFQLSARGFEDAAWSPDGRILATGSRDSVAHLWDATTGALLATLPHDAGVLRVRFDPQGGRVVTASRDFKARVWEVPSGKRLLVLVGHDERVCSAAFDPEGARIATTSDDRTVRIWDAATGEPLAVTSGHGRAVRDAEWSPDGSQLATSGDDRTVRLCRGDTGEELAVLRGHSSIVFRVEFSPDGARLASGAIEGKLWRAADPWDLLDRNGLGGRQFMGTFDAAGARLATSGSDGIVRVWDVETGRLERTLRGSSAGVGRAEFSPDGRYLASACYDRTARVWDLREGSCVAELGGHGDLVRAASFSPDGERLLTGSHDKLVRLWDWRKGALLRTLKGHGGRVLDAKFTLDGLHAVTGATDGGLFLWDLETGEVRAKLAGHQGSVIHLALRHDGARLLSSGYDDTARLWDLPSGTPVAVLRGHVDNVFQSAFSPDGRLVATASADRTVCVWNAATGEEIARSEDYPGLVLGVGFRRGGAEVVAWSADGAVRVFPTDPLAAARASQPRPLQERERAEFGLAAASRPAR